MALRAWVRWGFHPQTPDKGLRPLTPCALRAGFKQLSEHSIPYSHLRKKEQPSQAALLHSIHYLVGTTEVP